MTVFKKPADRNNSSLEYLHFVFSNMFYYFSEYANLTIFSIIAAGLGLVLLGLSFVISKKHTLDSEKLSAYECRFDPFSDCRSEYNIHFYYFWSWSGLIISVSYNSRFVRTFYYLISRWFFYWINPWVCLCLADGCIRDLNLRNFLSITPQELLFSFPQEFLMEIGLLGLLVICLLSNITGVHIFTIIFFLSIVCVIFGFFACNTHQPSFLVSIDTKCTKLLVCLLFILVLSLDDMCVKSGKNTLLLMGFFLFLSLELLTLTSDCLIALPRTQRSLEAVLKYFFCGWH